MDEITKFFRAVRKGETRSTEELIPLVYEELRRLAAYRLAQERPGQTLQATALVHETYLRLSATEGDGWENQRHFFGAAAEAMRRILVENARRKSRFKRGGDLERVHMDDASLAIEAPREDVIALSEALEQLTRIDPQAAELVKLRFFAGLTLRQCADLQDVSPRTADNIWAFARAWLYRAMLGEQSPSNGDPP